MRCSLILPGFFLVLVLSASADQNSTLPIAGDVPNLDTAVVVTPTSITLTGPPGTLLDQPLQIKNFTSSSITFSVSESLASQAGAPPSPTGGQLEFAPVIRRLKGQKPIVTATPPPAEPLVFTTAFNDTRGDNFLVGVDLIEVLWQKRTIPIVGTVLDLRVRMLNPDSAVAGFLTIDIDQDFGTGIWPAPWNLGPRTRDLGAEFEILVDLSGQISDSLGFGNNPIAVIFRTADTSVVLPLFPTVTFDSVLTATISSIPLGVLGLNDPDGNLNIGAVFARLSSTPFPDFGPDYGHGIVGVETGVSWIRENRTSVTVASGDSAIVDVSILAAKPAGTYTATLKLAAPGQPPIYVPVQMNVMGAGTPSIGLNATSFGDTLMPGDSSTFQLTISNTGTGDLFWGILDTAGTSWASAFPAFGLVGPGLSSPTSIKFVSAGLSSDTTYSSYLQIVCNDPASPTIAFHISLTVQPSTTVEMNVDQTPTSYALHQNYPNPFNPETNIIVDIPRTTFVTLKLYNLLGQEIQTIEQIYLPAGKYRYRVRAENLPSGVYLYRITADGFNTTRKMVLLR